MSTIAVVQGTQEWLQLRAGKVTASRIADVAAKIKTGESASRRNYKAQIVVERLTGLPCESGYISKEMQWGTENEPFARAAYEIRSGAMVDQVGFVDHPTIDRSGASPDGLVGDDGMVEIKCPNTATHIEYILGKEAPAEYQQQMLWQMDCTGRQWVDFVSYDPRLPEHLQLFVVRFVRDNERIKQLESEVVKFNAEVDEIIAKLPKA